MNITVQIPTALRRLTAGNARVTCSAGNLGELFTALDQQFPDLKPHLRDEAGEIRRFLNVYVNEEDIRFLGGTSTRFRMEMKCCWCHRSPAARADCCHPERHCVSLREMHAESKDPYRSQLRLRRRFFSPVVVP